MKITVDIPEHVQGRGIRYSWEQGYKIIVESNEDEIVIKANRAGLISLARQMLTLAQENVSEGTHFHYDEYNSLEGGSRDLVIAKTE